MLQVTDSTRVRTNHCAETSPTPYQTMFWSWGALKTANDSLNTPCIMPCKRSVWVGSHLVQQIQCLKWSTKDDASILVGSIIYVHIYFVRAINNIDRYASPYSIRLKRLLICTGSSLLRSATVGKISGKPIHNLRVSNFYRKRKQLNTVQVYG